MVKRMRNTVGNAVTNMFVTAPPTRLDLIQDQLDNLTVGAAILGLVRTR
jgi:hypothetical protein